MRQQAEEASHRAFRLAESASRLQLHAPSLLSEQWVRHQRATLGLTIEDYSNALGVHYQTVVGWESGETSPTLFAVIQMELIDLILLSTRYDKHFSIADTIFGRLFTSGVLDREEIRTVLLRIGLFCGVYPEHGLNMLPFVNEEEEEDAKTKA